MEKRTHEMALLLDFYGELLTTKQREYLELYYQEDYSLAEIAAMHSITPQGVRDAILRGEGALKTLEDKTKFLARLQEISQTSQALEAKLKEIATQSSPSLQNEFEQVYADLQSLQL